MNINFDKIGGLYSFTMSTLGFVVMLFDVIGYAGSVIAVIKRVSS
jgi:hypothetical protein